MVPMAEVSEVSGLVLAAASGDGAAWNELVRRFSPLVMAVTRSYRLPAADAQDVSQTVWLRLVEHLANLREPEALPGWLARTTQHECSRQVRRAPRGLPPDPPTDRGVQPPPVAATAAGSPPGGARPATADRRAGRPARRPGRPAVS